MTSPNIKVLNKTKLGVINLATLQEATVQKASNYTKWMDKI